MEQIAGWWDGFELWVAGLPFIPQFVVVLLGMVPISVAIAMGLDRTLRAVLHLLGRDGKPEQGAPGRTDPPADPAADGGHRHADPAAHSEPPRGAGAAPIIAARPAELVGPPLTAAAGPAGVR
ncbi:hypothetical protein [Nocardia jiangsuensis]|uniref:Uncharacterized protein n=1 Tax=Nocardia jiangsuensis TaxID=1691563 RepID=A0ABV8E3W3_9NOCA